MKKRLALLATTAWFALSAAPALAQDNILPKPEKPFAGKIGLTRET